MATLRAYQSIDMKDTSPSIGDAVYADRDTVIVEYSGGATWYLGDFRYPGGEWKGTIKTILDFDFFDDIVFEVRGLELATKYATTQVSPARAIRTAFEGNDRIFGSSEADRLAGHDGNDRISGGGGRDALFGDDGADMLGGGSGDDELRGGVGRDLLEGGRGDDTLWGNAGRDEFLFGDRDGRDIVRDYEDRPDLFVIDGSPTRFRDLEVDYTNGGDVVIRFERTEIVVRDVDQGSLTKSDFDFI